MKVLVDTNVWLDLLIYREAHFAFSKGAIMACIEDNLPLFTAATSLKDIFYLIDRSLGNKEAYAAIEAILEISNIATIDELVCREALQHERPDYEDGIIAAAALTEKASCILTRDTKAFCNLDIPSQTPKEFLEAQGYTEIDW